MSLGVADAIKQIDDVLAQFEAIERSHLEHFQGPSYGGDPTYISAPVVISTQMITTMRSAILRLAQNGASLVETTLKGLGDSDGYHSQKMRRLAGVLRSLKDDYQAGRLKRFDEMVRSDVFSDFLEMAEHFVKDEGLKDPAAVIAGGVLEQHLRKMCANRGIPTTFTDGKGNTVPKKLNLINQDLAKAGAYGGNDQKQIVAWADIRNDAAHAHYGNYTHPQVVLMVAGIRDFLARNPG